MTQQTTQHVVMIRPRHFGFNSETAVNNIFQKQETNLSPDEISARALQEFDDFAMILTENGVEVLVIEDTSSPVKPDAIFPNNWFSTHPDGALITYPLYSPMRRAERREEVIRCIEKAYVIERRYALEHYEEDGKFLEGTGSLVLDHVHQIAYACLSERTDIELVDKFCVLRGMHSVVFKGIVDGLPVYHTNVVMALGQDIAVVCLDCIPDGVQRDTLTDTLLHSGKSVIAISIDQLHDFAGNMLFLNSHGGDILCVMSERARSVLTGAQIGEIERYCNIVSSSLETIEAFGGGSARCMLAENFLSRR